MENNKEEYIYPRVKLSHMYEEIKKYLYEYGDADIQSISSISGSDDKAEYSINLIDLNSFKRERIGEIRIKREDVPYTKEEWRSGEITVSKIDKAVHI